jgi:chemotaxis signal transduction protein
MGLGKEAMTTEGRRTEIRAFLLPLAVDDAAGNVFCLFSQSQVVEILGPRPIQRIPFSPAYLEGVVNYFDQLLPVINLEELCNREPVDRNGKGYRQLVVIRTATVDPASGEPLKAVIGVGTKVRMTKISPRILAATFSGQEPPVSLQSTGLLRGFFQLESGGVALIDLSRVMLGTFGDVAQERKGFRNIVEENRAIDGGAKRS